MTSAAVTVVIGVGIQDDASDRARNLTSCVESLARQTLPRAAYRIVLIEQGAEARVSLQRKAAVDHYAFIANPNPFNRSWVLNVGATLAAGGGVLCTFDADLIVPPYFLERGLLAWQCGALAQKPFSEVLYLDAESTEGLHRRVRAGDTVDCDSREWRGDVHPWSKGGCIWVDTALYHQMGGHDERFEGWGLEDREFWDRLEERTRILTLPGRILHMYHTREVEQHVKVFESAVLYRGLLEGLLPRQRHRIGDPDRYRHAAAVSTATAHRAAVASDESGAVDEDELLTQVDAICRGTPLSREPAAASLRMRGVFAARQGNADQALACLAAAASSEPNDARGLLALGRARLARAQTNDAMVAQLRALSVDPNSAVPYRELGRTLRAHGRISEVTLALQEAWLLDLMNTDIVCELADVLREQGQLKQATAASELAVRMRPNDVRVMQHLAELRLARGEWEEARSLLRQALDSAHATSLAPGSRRALDREATHKARSTMHAGLGEALVHLERLDEAVAELRRAVGLDIHNMRACEQLARTLDQLGRTDEAAAAWIALGIAREHAGRHADAAHAYEQALARVAGSIRALTNLARMQAVLGRHEEALSRFEAALAIEPSHPTIRAEMGRAAHAIGDVDRGWHGFGAFAQDRPFSQPLWDGSPLAGRTILVWADQAMGDSIQGLRDLPAVQAAGGRVIVECQSRLTPLVARIPGIAQVVSSGAPLPAFDVQVPLCMIPYVHQASRWPVPALPQGFAADERLILRWRQRMSLARRASTRVRVREDASPGDEMTVGLSWGGNADGVNAQFRFTSLASFAPLGGTPGVRFISLQMGPQACELLSPPDGLVVEHLQDDACSMDDTAALMANLDLVISVDTAVAHLAGALSRPTWLVLPHVADWRWRRETESTALYPTMRLFRQREAGDWQELFQRVRAALEAHVSLRRHHAELPARDGIVA